MRFCLNCFLNATLTSSFLPIPVDAFDQTMDYSTQIFSLGVLLSSLLVFNQVRGTGCMFVCVLILLIQFHSFHTYGTGSFQQI